MPLFCTFFGCFLTLPQPQPLFRMHRYFFRKVTVKWTRINFTTRWQHFQAGLSRFDILKCWQLCTHTLTLTLKHGFWCFRHPSLQGRAASLNSIISTPKLTDNFREQKLFDGDPPLEERKSLSSRKGKKGRKKVAANFNMTE